MTGLSDWSKIYEEGNDFRTLTPYELTSLLQYISKKDHAKRALDIGCGTGQLTRDLWFRGFSVKGIDPSAKGIEIAKSASVAVLDNTLEYSESDVFGLSDLERYNLIFCKLVYAFIEHKKIFLDTIKKHLRPYGTFILITPVLGSKISTTKPFICVDHDLTIKQLTENFGGVTVHTLGMSNALLSTIKDKPL